MAIQDNTTQEHPVVAATRARQGRWGKHMLWVLIVSTALAALVLMATWGANSDNLAAVEGNQRADSQAEAQMGETIQVPARQNETTPLPVK
jgi:hypothetical protein